MSQPFLRTQQRARETLALVEGEQGDRPRKDGFSIDDEIGSKYDSGEEPENTACESSKNSERTAGSRGDVVINPIDVYAFQKGNVASTVGKVGQPSRPF